MLIFLWGALLILKKICKTEFEKIIKMVSWIESGHFKSPPPWIYQFLGGHGRFHCNKGNIHFVIICLVIAMPNIIVHAEHANLLQVDSIRKDGLNPFTGLPWLSINWSDFAPFFLCVTGRKC